MPGPWLEEGLGEGSSAPVRHSWAGQEVGDRGVSKLVPRCLGHRYNFLGNDLGARSGLCSLVRT